MENKNGAMKQVICGVIILLIASWITFISVKSITLDVRLTVLEAVASTIKEDIQEIKQLIKDVRDDQKRRQKYER